MLHLSNVVALHLQQICNISLHQIVSTAMKWLISGVLSAKNQQRNTQLLLDAETEQPRSTKCAADI